MDVSDEDGALHVAGKTVSDHKTYKKGQEAVTGIMAKFYVDSTASNFGSAVDPEAVMTSTCVVLSAASVTPLKFPEFTLKFLASLKRIEKGLDKMLTTPLNTAIDYYKTVINAVLTMNFKTAFETLPLLKDNATTAFHYANKKNVGIESFS